MALDLELPTMSRAMEQFPELGTESGRRIHGTQYWEEIELMRTYLGCYYLSAS